MKRYNCPDCPMNDGSDIDVCGLCKRANVVPIITPNMFPTIIIKDPNVLPCTTPLPYYPGDYPSTITCKINKE
ncbi:MAG TPA: hypothetical protein VK190_02995 [Pseudoneobacillus sp.]|jgi:hypothetical protein|nr:hypothetical protein [Pseudoneobacillus sp.]